MSTIYKLERKLNKIVTLRRLCMWKYPQLWLLADLRPENFIGYSTYTTYLKVEKIFKSLSKENIFTSSLFYAEDLTSPAPAS